MAINLATRIGCLRRMILIGLLYAGVVCALLGGHFLSKAHFEKLAHRHAFSNLTQLTKSAAISAASFGAAFKRQIKRYSNSALEPQELKIELTKDLDAFFKQFPQFSFNTNIDIASACEQDSDDVYLQVRAPLSSTGQYAARFSSCLGRAASDFGVIAETDLSALFDLSTIDLPFEHLFLVDAKHSVLHRWRREDLGARHQALVSATNMATSDVLVRDATSLLVENEHKNNPQQSTADTRGRKAQPNYQRNTNTRAAAHKVNAATVLEHTIAGEDYVIFAVPANAPYPITSRVAPAKWLYIGVISRAELNAQARSHARGWGLGIIGALIFALCSLPLIKVHFQGKQMAFTYRDLVIATVSGVALIAAVALAIGGRIVWEHRRDEWYTQAHQLAHELDKNFARETAKWARWIEDIASPSTDALARQNGRTRPQDDDPRPHHAHIRTATEHCSKSEPRHDGVVQHASCPAFDIFFTTNNKGEWQTGSAVSNLRVEPQPSSLHKRAYFQSASFGETNACIGERAPLPISIEQVRAYSSGRKLTVLAVPWQDFRRRTQPGPSFVSTDPTGIRPCAARRAMTPTKVFVAALETETFVTAALPPPFAYAVVDRAGKVLFHSIDNLALVENIGGATDNNPDLLAALNKGRSRRLAFNYHTQAHIGVTIPLNGLHAAGASPPWQLIVFAPKRELYEIWKNTMITADVIVAGFLGASVVLLSLLVTVWYRVVRRPDHRPQLPWPTPIYLNSARKRLLCSVAVALIAVSCVYAGVNINTTSPYQWIVWLALLACTLAIAVVIVFPVKQPNRGATPPGVGEIPAAKLTRHHSVCYGALGAVALCVIVIVPAGLALYQAHQIQSNLLQKHTELQLEAKEKAIQQRLAHKYAHILHTPLPAHARGPHTYRVVGKPSAEQVYRTSAPAMLGIFNNSRWATFWHAPQRTPLGTPAQHVTEQKDLLGTIPTYALCVITMLALLWSGPRWLARRVLGYGEHYARCARLPTDLNSLRGQKVILLDEQGNTWARLRNHFGDDGVVDFRRKPENALWQSWLPARDAEIWLIDGGEAPIYDPHGRATILDFFEMLSDAHGHAPRTVIIRSAIEPTFWLDYARTASGDDTPRWGRLTAAERYRFERLLGDFDIYAEPAAGSAAPNPRADTSIGAEVNLNAAQRARFRYLWRLSTSEERLVLHELALGHIINPRNTAVLASLIARGLIEDSKPLNITSPALRHFALSAEPEHRWQQYADRRGRSTWDAVRGPVIFLIAVFTVFLLVQFRAQMPGLIPALTSLIAIIPVVEKMLAFGQGRASITG